MDTNNRGKTDGQSFQGKSISFYVGRGTGGAGARAREKAWGSIAGETPAPPVQVSAAA